MFFNPISCCAAAHQLNLVICPMLLFTSKSKRMLETCLCSFCAIILIPTGWFLWVWPYLGMSEDCYNTAPQSFCNLRKSTRWKLADTRFWTKKSHLKDHFPTNEIPVLPIAVDLCLESGQFKSVNHMIKSEWHSFLWVFLGYSNSGQLQKKLRKWELGLTKKYLTLQVQIWQLQIWQLPTVNKQNNKPGVLPVVHYIGWLIIRVNRVLITNLVGPLSLLIHVGPTDQLGSKAPTFTSRQFYVHSYIIISLLQSRKSVNESLFIETNRNQVLLSSEF